MNKIIALTLLLSLCACATTKHDTLKSPCVGADKSPCVRKPINEGVA